jgi:hypothetical protein
VLACVDGLDAPAARRNGTGSGVAERRQDDAPERRAASGPVAPLVLCIRDVDVPDAGVEVIDALQRHAFAYFAAAADAATGLVADALPGDSPASIAAVGFALAAYPVGVERGYLSRAEAVARALAALRFFWTSPQGPQPDATGYRGFYYHFLDRGTGRRALGCELSTVDTAWLLAGALTAGAYFDGDAPAEREVRTLADGLYRRADWRWAQNGEAAAGVAQGWTPERGFLPARWRGYCEALLLYVLGLGSPTHPLPPASYGAWTATYRWRRLYGHDLLYGGPLFLHVLSHAWVDFRGIRDAFMRARGSDYFENSRRALHVQRRYAVRNPRGFPGYGADAWGLSASDGPGPGERAAGGRRRRLFAYRARGCPFGPDDGTLAPAAVAAALPFEPSLVVPALRRWLRPAPGAPPVVGAAGLAGGLNPGGGASPAPGRPSGAPWVSPRRFGIDQGPVVVMLENHRSGLVWRLMRTCPYVAEGLRRAGFSGGWLGP